MKFSFPGAVLITCLAAFATSAQAELNWTQTSGPQSPVVLQVVPYSGDTGFLVTTGGIFKTTNGGTNWTSVPAPFMPTGRHPQSRAAVMAADGQRIYLTYSPEQVGGKGLFVSTDAGATWQSYLGSGGTAIQAFRGSNPVIDAENVYLLQEGVGLKRSPHGGAVWTDITPPGITSFSTFDLDQLFRANGSLCLYVPGTETYSGIYRSTTQGGSWTLSTGNPTDSFDAVFAVDPTGNTAYMAAGQGIYRSTDGCATWEKQDATGLGGFTRPDFAFGVGHDGALYWNRANSLFRSTDGGDSFTSDISGDLQTLINQGGGGVVAVGHIGTNTIAGLAGAGVMRRSASWTAINDGAISSSVGSLFSSGERLFASTPGAGLFSTNDAGASWIKRNGGLTGLQAPHMARLGTTLYAAHAKNNNISLPGIFKSIDGGANWTASSNGIPDFSNLIGIVSDGTTLYVGVNSVFSGDPDQVHVWRSTDGGANWAASGAGLPGGSNQISSIAANSTAVFAAMGDRTLWRSTDSGVSWQQLGVNADAAGDALKADNVYALPSGIYFANNNTSIGVLNVSKDNGDTWSIRTPVPANFIAEDGNGTLYGSVVSSGSGKLSVLKRGSNSWVTETTNLPRNHNDRILEPTDIALHGGTVYLSGQAAVWSAPPAAAPTADTEPDAFQITDQLSMPEGSFNATSAPVTITGLSAPAPIFVRGGGGASFQINCTGTFFSDDNRTISNNQTICVRHSNSLQTGRRTNTSVTIGGVSDTFTSAIGGSAADTTPAAFSFASAGNVALSSLQTSNSITVSEIDAATPIRVSNGAYSIGCNSSFVTTAGSISNGQSVCVRHTASASPATAVTTVLTIGDVSASFTSTTVAADTTPEVFSFTPQTGVAPGALAESATAVINGINTATPVSIVGGEYRINGGTYTTANGNVNPGDTVQVRHSASMLFNTTTSTTLTVGGVSATFNSTTRAQQPDPDTTPDPFSFNARTDVTPGSVVTSNRITVSGINAATAISIQGGTYRIGDGAFTNQNRQVVNGNEVEVRVVAAAAGQTQEALLTIGGVTAGFSVTSRAQTPPDGGSQAQVMDSSNRPVTITASSGTLTNARRVAPPQGGFLGARFLNGVFAFEITGVAPNSIAQVTIDLPADSRPNRYLKFGTELGNPVDHYYRFDFDPGTGTGAQIRGSRVTLFIQDNGRGDHDPTPGQIADPGGPAIVEEPVSASSGGGAWGIWGLLMGLAAVVRTVRHGRKST